MDEESLILHGVVAYVEVRSNNDNRSAAICQQLRQLGARVEPNFNDDVTHIVFKEGLKRTWTKAIKHGLPLVSVSWLHSCKQNQKHMPEKDFPAILPETNSPLPQLVQAPRWKKMKSMQPCDFDEEIARSAERGEKRRKRAIMANRFKLTEEATPTSSSPVPILALETQPRSPTLSLFMRSSSPIPDTPPSMKERLERMRREQKQVLSMDEPSVATTPKPPADWPLQRRLFDKLGSDFASTEDSSDEEITSQFVAKVIQSLDTNSESGSQSPRHKESTKTSSHDSHTVKTVADASKQTGMTVQTCGEDPLPDKVLMTTNDVCNKGKPLRNRRSLKVSQSGSYQDMIESNTLLAKNISLPTLDKAKENKESNYNRNETVEVNQGNEIKSSSCSKSPRSMACPLSPQNVNIDKLSLNPKLPETRLSDSQASKRLSPPSFVSSSKSAEEIIYKGDGSNKNAAAVCCESDNTELLVRKDTKNSSVRPQNSAKLSEITYRQEEEHQKSVKEIVQERASNKAGTTDTSQETDNFENRRRSRRKSTAASKVESKSASLGRKDITSQAGSVETVVPPQRNSSAPLHPKITKKKRNLFTEPALCSSLLGPKVSRTHTAEEISFQDTLTSNKVSQKEAKSTSKSEVSFLFGVSDSNKSKQEDSQQRRKSRRLSAVNATEKALEDETTVKAHQRQKKTITSDSKHASEAATSGDCTRHCSSSLTDSVLKNDTLGTSMSVVYGNDTTLSDVTKRGTSRRSIDEFVISSRQGARMKKRVSAAPSLSNVSETGHMDVKSKQKGKELADKSVKNAADSKTNGDTQKGKRSRSSLENCGTKEPPGKKLKASTSVSSDAEAAGDSLSLSETTVSTDVAPSRLRHARSLVMERSNHLYTKNSSYSLVVTSLHREEQEIVYSVVKKLGIFHMTNNVEASTTHVVCGEVRRTLNVLRAIARGCWLLRLDWVMQSLEAGEWLLEEDFEVDNLPAGKKSRKHRHKEGSNYKLDLFSKTGFIYVSSACTPPRKDLVQLITLCCGQVTASESRAAVHIGDNHNPDKLVIKPTWVLDSIMKLETQQEADYIVPAPVAFSQREKSPEF